MKFHTVLVIYNPNSTGDSEKNARIFTDELKKRSKDLSISLRATKYAGHAKELAETFGQNEDVVIVSSSGDGGYNEVVNGILGSGGKATLAVLPSGNANDHHGSVGSDDLVGSILSGKKRMLESIELSVTHPDTSWTRYAHSYIGLGLTPKVGKDLTELRPNVVAEKWHVLRHLLTLKHITVMVEGKRLRYTNLIFATIDRMSKVVKLDSNSKSNDGKMEIYTTEYISVLGILKLLITAGFAGLSSEVTTQKYEFTTVRPTLVQLDGEVATIARGSVVTVTCRKDSIRTFA